MKSEVKEEKTCQHKLFATGHAWMDYCDRPVKAGSKFCPDHHALRYPKHMRRRAE